jgi:hypothetical protein
MVYKNFTEMLCGGVTKNKKLPLVNKSSKSSKSNRSNKSIGCNKSSIKSLSHPTTVKTCNQKNLGAITLLTTKKYNCCEPVYIRNIKMKITVI